MRARQHHIPRAIFSLIKSISSALCDPKCQRDSVGVWGIFVVFFLQLSCLDKSIFMSESSTEPSMFILATDRFENVGKWRGNSDILEAIFAGIWTKPR